MCGLCERFALLFVDGRWEGAVGRCSLEEEDEEERDEVDVERESVVERESIGRREELDLRRLELVPSVSRSERIRVVSES